MKGTSSFLVFTQYIRGRVGIEKLKEIEREGKKTDKGISVNANRPKIHELCGSHNNNKYLTLVPSYLIPPDIFFS